MEEDLREAVCIGNEDRVIKYIKSGVNVNSQNSVNGWSALHWASKRGYANMVRLLLDAGAKPDMLTKDGKTPLRLSSNKEIRKLLDLQMEFKPFKSGNPVWRYYLRAKNRERAKCETCQTTISCRGGSTGALRNHLLYKHKINLKKLSPNAFPLTTTGNPTGTEDGVEASSETNDDGQIGFLPNYLKYPQFPYTSDPKSAERGSESASGISDADQSNLLSNYLKHAQLSCISDSKNFDPDDKERGPMNLDGQASFATTGFLFQPQKPFLINRTEWSPCGLPVDPRHLVLKVRVLHDASSSDFMEINFNRKEILTFDKFELALLSEFSLEDKIDQIKCIRKLPDTIMRNDADIQRLTDYQKLEITFNPVSMF